jgi:hypothetical protein
MSSVLRGEKGITYCTATVTGKTCVKCSRAGKKCAGFTKVVIPTRLDKLFGFSEKTWTDAEREFYTQQEQPEQQEEKTTETKVHLYCKYDICPKQAKEDGYCSAHMSEPDESDQEMLYDKVTPAATIAPDRKNSAEATKVINVDSCDESEPDLT